MDSVKVWSSGLKAGEGKTVALESAMVLMMAIS
jgi:hypothetical protein